MAVVAGGLGLPADGALVAQGLGLSEPAAPSNALVATLAGSGTLTATLTATGTEPPPTVGGGNLTIGLPHPTGHRIGHMTADLSGSSALTAAIDYYDFSPLIAANNLLLLELV